MRLPDESTILRFRHRLETHKLADQILATVNALLEQKGLLLKAGTAVDATLIPAPTSTKNKDKARDPEMHSSKKGNEWYFGMKAHIGVDADSGLVHALSNADRKALFTTIANLTRERVPLMAGINSTSTDETIDLGRFAKDAGYTSILVAAPYYCQPTQDELLAHTLAVDDALDLPAMLYNFPARTGTLLIAHQV